MRADAARPDLFHRHYQPSTEKESPRVMADRAAAVYGTVLAGGWAGSAQRRPAHLCGSRFTGSPAHRVTVVDDVGEGEVSGVDVNANLLIGFADRALGD